MRPLRPLLLALLVSCGSNPPHQPVDLKVMAGSPTESIDKLEPITLKFDKPVIDDAEVGNSVDPRSITVTPAIAWKGFWQDRQTVVIQPTGVLASGMRYHVMLAGDLAARSAPYELAFVYKPLAVQGLGPEVNSELLALDADLPVVFNQPVRAADAAAHCLLAVDGGIPLALRAAQPDAKPAAIVQLHAVAPLTAGSGYTLTCADLTSATGDAPLEKPYQLGLLARPALELRSYEPSGSDAIPADEASIVLTFTTPVTLDAIHGAISSVPAIPGLTDGFLSGDSNEYRVTADLDAQTTYKVTLAPFADTFGQKLAAPQTFTFKTADARPRLNLERGIFAVEANAAKGYPVWTRNIGKYTVECGAIPKSHLVQLLTSDMQYDPWGGNNDDKPLDWAKLHVQPTTRAHKVAERNKWVQTPLDLGGTCGGATGKRGVFLAELHSDEIVPDFDRPWMTPRRNRVLANVTDLGVLLKVGPASGIVWVTSFATAAPIPGATVTIFTPSGRQAFTGTTDADGVLNVPGSAILRDKPKAAVNGDPEAANDFDGSYGGREQRVIAVVENAGDLAVVDGNWSNGIQVWNFAVDEAPTDQAVRIRGFIQSDRGLYRPGEQVHFKGLAREITAVRPPRVPQKQPVAVEVMDGRGQSILTQTVPLTAFGGFSFDLQLAPDAGLGDYYVSATIGKQTFREKFTVEEFRPAAFELNITRDDAAKAVKPGDKLSFQLDAKYLFGSPVAGANVEWNLRRRKHTVSFPGFDEYTFSADPHDYWWYERANDYGDFIADGKADTDGSGHLAIAASEQPDGTAGSDADTTPSDEPARAPVPTTAGPVDYIISASVTDATNQSITKSVIVTAHRTSLYLGVHASEYVQAVDMPFGINLVALKPDGTRAATKAHLSFTRTDWVCTWGTHGYRGYQHCDSKPDVAEERDVEIAAGGSHTERVVPKKPGDYLVRIATKDEHGNDVAAESEIYVIGKGEAFWSGDEGDRMTIVTSKPVYTPGDVAKLVPMANLVDPTALITVERDGILSAHVTKLHATSEGILLPVADAWAPNVYVSVALVSGRHGALDKDRPAFKLGTVELKVKSEHKELAVAVALDAATVRPGDPVSGTITVTHGGKPVHAEVSLSAADEGVLQLIDYKTPNPMKTFYAPFGLGVEPATNWNRIARLADPTAGDPDQGGDMATKLNSQRVRSKFVASAYWAPALVTDDAGVIHFAFTAPDNLSAFRLMAVAADVADQFGAGETRLTVNKPLMAEPVLPRFLRTGDAADVGVLVHNTTDTAGTASIDASADGARLATTHATVDLPAHGEGRVRFAATAVPTAASATFAFAVTMNKDGDAVRVTLPVEKPRLIEVRTLVEAALADGKAVTTVVDAQPGVLRDESTLTLTIDRTGAGDLAPSLKALVEYPYGCLEQTMSHMVPLIAAKDLAATLDDGALDNKKAQHYIDIGVAKILRHQQSDGQFSLWPDSQTYPNLTAYALWGLTIAQRQGNVEVPADVFDRGMAALTEYSSKHFGEDNNTASLAMAAYVMALRGKPDANLNARLYVVRARLPKWGQAFLLRTLALTKASKAQVSDLEALMLLNLTTSQDGALVVHETSSREELDMYWSSDTRSTAVALLALMEVDPKSKYIDQLAAGLKAQRDHAGRWQSTQENLWALVALSDYAKRAAAGTTVATISVGGVALPAKKITGGQLAVIAMPLAKVAADAQISVSVDHAAHVTARVTEARADAGAGEHHGFTVIRRYLGDKGAPTKSVKAGDLVTVRIEITADDDQRWIAVNDPIPAGFEAVNAKLAQNGGADPAMAPPPGGDMNDRWRWNTQWDYQEMRDDGVRWFADRLSRGEHVLEYQARATTDGTFTAMPATVEHMYHPEVNGRSDKAVVTVTP